MLYGTEHSPLFLRSSTDLNESAVFHSEKMSHESTCCIILLVKTKIQKVRKKTKKKEEKEEERNGLLFLG